MDQAMAENVMPFNQIPFSRRYADMCRYVSVQNAAAQTEAVHACIQVV